MKAISVMQPWAELIVAGHKDIENRSWKTNIRGEILIHASKKFDNSGWAWMVNNWYKVGLPGQVGDFLDQMKLEDYQLGGIVGQVQIIDCVLEHGSPWKADSTYGFVLAHAKRLEFKPMNGRLGFFEVSMPWEVDNE